jgi:predicted MFS family arabinose efflux permease
VRADQGFGAATGVAPAAAEADEVRLVSRAFVVLALAALAFFVAGGIVLPVAPRFASGPLGADAVGFGISIGAFAIAALLARPIVGWASDRYGRRPLLLLGASVTIVGLGLHLLATDLLIFTLARGLLGIGEGFFFVAALAAGSDIAPPSRRGEALSFLSLSLYMGVVIGPVIGEVALANSGFDAVWLIAAGITAVALLLSLAVPETAPARLAAKAPGRDPGASRPRARLFHPRGLLPGVLVLAGSWGMSGYFTFVPLYATHVGLDGAGLPLAIYGLTVIVLRAFGARLPDRLGAARLSGVAMVVVVAGLSIIGLVPSPTGLLVGTAVYAGGVAFLFPALLTCAVGRVDPEERGSVLGTTSAFLDLGFGIGPVVLSLLAAGGASGTASLAGLSATFLISAAVAAAGAALLYTRRRDLAPPAVATA